MTKVDVVDGWFNRTIRNPLFLIFVVVIVGLSVFTYYILQLVDATNESKNATDNRTSVARQNQEILQDIEVLAEQIKSCTTPEGECAKRGEARGGDISVAITYCTLNLPPMATRDVVTKCIIKQLEPKP